MSTTFWCFSEISQLCTDYSRLLNNNNQIWPIYSKLIVKKIFCTMFYVDLFMVNDTHPGIRFDKVRILQQREVIVVESRMLRLSLLNVNCDYLWYAIIVIISAPKFEYQRMHNCWCIRNWGHHATKAPSEEKTNKQTIQFHRCSFCQLNWYLQIVVLQCCLMHWYSLQTIYRYTLYSLLYSLQLHGLFLFSTCYVVLSLYILPATFLSTLYI